MMNGGKSPECAENQPDPAKVAPDETSGWPISLGQDTCADYPTREEGAEEKQKEHRAHVVTSPRASAAQRISVQQPATALAGTDPVTKV